MLHLESVHNQDHDRVACSFLSTPVGRQIFESKTLDPEARFEAYDKLSKETLSRSFPHLCTCASLNDA